MNFVKNRFWSAKGLAILLLGFVAFSLQACLKDLPIDLSNPSKLDVNFTPSLAAPVAYGKITLKELLLSQKFDSANIKEDANKVITIVYQENLLSQKGEMTYDMPTQQDTTPIHFSDGFKSALNLAPVGTQLTPAPRKDFTEIEVDPEHPTTQVDSLLIKSGSVELTITSSFREDIAVQVNILSLKKNGTSFKYFADLNYSTSADTNSASYFKQSKLKLDLAGYLLDAVNGNPDTLRGIQSLVTMSIKKQKNTRPTDTLYCEFKMENLSFRTIYGSFPGIDLPVPPDSLQIDAFKNSPYKGNISLLDPRVSLLTHNSFGIPIGLKFKQFNATLSDGTKKDMLSDTSATGEFPHSTVMLPRPTVVGQFKDGIVTFDKDNSNISQILGGFPQAIRYDIQPIIQNTPGFIVDTSRIDIGVKAEVPLYLSIQNLAYSDTIDFTPQSGMDRAEEGVIKFISSNGFPFGLNVQGYFIDEKNVKVDSLFATGGQILVPAPVAADGLVMKSSVQQNIATINLGKTKLTAISKAKRLIIKGIIATTPPAGTGVKFASDNALDFKLGILIKNISLNKQ